MDIMLLWKEPVIGLLVQSRYWTNKFSKCLLSSCSVPGGILAVRMQQGTSTQLPAHIKLSFQRGEGRQHTNKAIKKHKVSDNKVLWRNISGWGDGEGLGGGRRPRWEGCSAKASQRRRELSKDLINKKEPGLWGCDRGTFWAGAQQCKVPTDKQEPGCVLVGGQFSCSEGETTWEMRSGGRRCFGGQGKALGICLKYSIISFSDLRLVPCYLPSDNSA